MKNISKKLYIVLTLVCLLACTLVFVACDKPGNTPSDDTGINENVYARCEEGLQSLDNGNYAFSIDAVGDYVFEDTAKDATFTLGNAFTGMQIVEKTLTEDKLNIYVEISGTLKKDEHFGKISSKNLVAGKDVVVNVNLPLYGAESSSVMYDNKATQTVTIKLINAYFTEDVEITDFVLSGAATGMEITQLEFTTHVDNNVTTLSDTIVLTIEGDLGPDKYAFVTITGGTTTNESLDVVLDTDYLGGKLLNNQVNFYELSDIVYIEANNLTFKETISASDIVLNGSLKGYATVARVEYVTEKLVEIELTAEYNYLNNISSLGSIDFNASATKENVAFSVAVKMSIPEITYDVTVNGKHVELSIDLANEEFNLGAVSYEVKNMAGDVIIVKNVDHTIVEKHYDMMFDLPQDFVGDAIDFVLEDAYTVIESDGASKKIPVILTINLK